MTEMWKAAALPRWSLEVSRRWLLRRRFGFDPWHVRATPANRPYKARVARLLVAHGATKVVDVGCGLGDLGSLLPRAVTYIGVDTRAPVLDAARQLHRNATNMSFLQGSFAEAGQTEADAVVSVAWVDGLTGRELTDNLLIAGSGARLLVIDAVMDKADSYSHLTLQIPGFLVLERIGPDKDPRLDRTLIVFSRS